MAHVADKQAPKMKGDRCVASGACVFPPFVRACTELQVDRGTLGNAMLKYRVMTSGYMETTVENRVIDFVVLTVVCAVGLSLFFLLRSLTKKILS